MKAIKGRVMTKEDIEKIREFLMKQEIVADHIEDKEKADAATGLMRFQLATLCDLAIIGLQERPVDGFRRGYQTGVFEAAAICANKKTAAGASHILMEVAREIESLVNK